MATSPEKQTDLPIIETLESIQDSIYFTGDSKNYSIPELDLIFGGVQLEDTSIKYYIYYEDKPRQKSDDLTLEALKERLETYQNNYSCIELL